MNERQSRQAMNATMASSNIKTLNVGNNAELSTSTGPMYQKWVVLEITPEHRRHFVEESRQLEQRKRMVALGLGLSTGLGVALVGGLAYGGYACLSHLFLRLILWRCGAMPLNYVRFLDYCAERIFLRKVGGGYIFIHRLLLKYFASLEDAIPKAP